MAKNRTHLPPSQQNRPDPGSLVYVKEQITHGPIPSPDILDGYEKILPGTADRIIRMAESALAHTQSCDVRHQQHRFIVTIMGQVFGLLIGLFGIGGGLYLAAADKSLVGFGVFFTSLATLAGVYAYNRRPKRQGKE